MIETLEQVKEHRKRMKSDPDYRKQYIIDLMESMKPFNKDDNSYIPDIPQADEDIYKNYIIPAYVRCGALPKSELIDGKKYYGSCRNASEAIWHQDKNCFTYTRYKFGFVYEEDINHFEDDDRSDLFIPLKLIN